MRLTLRPWWQFGAGTILLAILLAVPGPAARTIIAADTAPPSPATAGRQVSYLREVRPILAQHCFQCHGPDEAARKGKLRLDLKADALAARRGKHVIDPGNPAGSLVWERITTDDEDRRMP